MLLAEEPSGLNASRSMLPFTLLVVGLTMGFFLGRAFGHPIPPENAQEVGVGYEQLL